MIVEHIGKFITSKIVDTFLGEVVCDVAIHRSTPVFIPLKNIICGGEAHKLEVTGCVTKNILNIVNTSNIFKKIIQHDNMKNKYSLHIDKNDFLLENDNYCSEEEEIKIYSKKELYFVFKYIQKHENTKTDTDEKKTTRGDMSDRESPHDHERIEIKIVKFTDKKFDKFEVNDIFNDFMKNDLNLESRMIYTARIAGSDSVFSDMISRFFAYTYCVDTKFCIGNNVFDGLEDGVFKTNNSFDISFDVKNLNETTENIQDLVKFNAKKSSGDNFYRLYEHFVGKYDHVNKEHMKNNIHGMNQEVHIDYTRKSGYFINDNTIYFLSDSPRELTIVSVGVLLSVDVLKDKLKYLFDESWKSKNSGGDGYRYSPRLYSYDNNHWKSFSIEPRELNTVYLPSNTRRLVVNEIDNFVRLSKLYKLCSIPYKKGILLYGPPGTGKTSLVKSLAYEYQMDIYNFNLNDENINDDSVNHILNSMGSTDNKILLFEDIDAAFAEKEQIKSENKCDTFLTLDKKDGHNKKLKFLTYSGLLNALDGVMTNHYGVITIMTTNHIERLGDALIRPGRIDLKVLLKECNSEQIKRMCDSIITKYISITNECTSVADKNGIGDKNIINSLRYADNTFRSKKIDEFAKNIVDSNGESNITPSKLQTYILKYIRNIDDIFDNYTELL